jgi:TRAP-type C4-dicarboxylate transport system permease small subunit
LSDIISYSFPITTFTGAALLFKKADGHIAITFLTDMLNGKIGKILHYICEFFTYVVLIYILLWGVQFAFNGQFQFSPALNIKLIYVFSVVPLFALSGLVFKLEKLLVK